MEESLKENVERSIQKEAEALLKKYPEKRSALLPLLHCAQEANGGWLSRACIETVANLLSLQPLQVYEVVSFYTMFHTHPVGRYHFQICRTASCYLRGAQELTEICKKKGLAPKKPSENGAISFEEVECLGACAAAPVVQVNNKKYYENLSAEAFEKMLENPEKYCEK